MNLDFAQALHILPIHPLLADPVVLVPASAWEAFLEAIAEDKDVAQVDSILTMEMMVTLAVLVEVTGAMVMDVHLQVGDHHRHHGVVDLHHPHHPLDAVAGEGSAMEMILTLTLTLTVLMVIIGAMMMDHHRPLYAVAVDVSDLAGVGGREKIMTTAIRMSIKLFNNEPFISCMLFCLK